MTIQKVRFEDEIWASLAWGKFLWQAVVNTVNEASSFIQGDVC